MPEIQREEFTAWMELIRGDIHGVHERLDALNGRTRANEQDIAVLKERSPATKGEAARWGGGLGVGVVAVIEAIKALMK